MKKLLFALLLSVGLTAGPAFAATISFTDKPLVVVETDDGTGIFANTPLGTPFTGNIDDVTFNGSISGGGNSVDFTCCIFAGGLELSNDTLVTADSADFINLIAGTTIVNEGDLIDSVDIEGDTFTARDGRIEVGISYILNPDAFDSEDLSNYPFDPSKIKLAVFFILEEDAIGAEIYSGIGRIQVVPLPAAVWLFGSAIGLLGFMRRLSRRSIRA